MTELFLESLWRQDSEILSYVTWFVLKSWCAGYLAIIAIIAMVNFNQKFSHEIDLFVKLLAIVKSVSVLQSTCRIFSVLDYSWPWFDIVRIDFFIVFSNLASIFSLYNLILLFNKYHWNRNCVLTCSRNSPDHSFILFYFHFTLSKFFIFLLMEQENLERWNAKKDSLKGGVSPSWLMSTEFRDFTETW